MRPIAYNRIQNLANEFTNPKRASWLMRDYLKNAIKLSNNTLNKDTILRFRNKRIGLKDVEEIAESVLFKMKSSDKSREAKYDIVKDLMKHKLKDATKCTKEAKTELNDSKANLDKVVRKGTIVRSEFMELVDKELTEVWTEAKNKNQEKLIWNVKRQKSKITENEGTFKGVLIGDKELETLEKESAIAAKFRNENKAVVYAGIEVNKNEDEILTLPPDHAIFPKVDIEEFDTEVEKCIIKCQWEVNKEERIAEQMKAKEEASEELEESVKTDDNEAKLLDFRNLRATEFKNNKRVILPHPGDDTEEIRRSNLKSEFKKVVLKYKKENCDKFGNILKNNLNDKQMKNLKNLKSRIKEEGLVCSQTDKTGKLTLDTLENITSKMEKHIQDDKVINEKYVKKLENSLNNHMGWWMRIIQPGKNNNQTRRIKSNLVTKDNQIPILRGTSKDHKQAVDEKVGPDLRPIMGAIVGPNIGLSELGSILVRKIAEHADIGLVATSTEEVLEKVEEYNKNRKKNIKLRKVIIASMDIEKCYPNILSLPSAKIIRRMWVESDLEIEGIEVDFLCRYLGKYLKPNEVIEEGFEELLYSKKIKKKNTSKKISRKHVKHTKARKKATGSIKDNEGLDTSSSNDGADTIEAATEENRREKRTKKILDNKVNQNDMDTDTSKGDDTLEIDDEKKKDTKKKKKTQEWTKPKRQSTLKEQRQLFGKALEIMLVACMDNHVYQFNNQIRVQKKGGPIGLKLTGEIFDCIMIDWDKKNC